MQKFLKKQFILLHGAWHGSWCWKYIVPALEAKGHAVSAPDLPGHGADLTPFSEISLKTYVDFVIQKINACEEPVILVGHSMAGVILTQVAENIPEKIRELVYVSAFIPENGASLRETAEQFKSTGMSAEMVVNKAEYCIALQQSERLEKFFYNYCNAEDTQFALQHLQREPARPFMDPVYRSSEKFGRVKKHYIACTQDHVVLLQDQMHMAAMAFCQMSKLRADHSPFFSDREKLVELLIT